LLIKGEATLTNGVPIEAAPLVRQVAASAYRQGARLVDVIWGDAEVHLARFRHASREALGEFPDWQVDGLLSYIQGGDAVLIVMAESPELLDGQDPAAVADYQETVLRHTRVVRDLLMRDVVPHVVVCAAVPVWAAKVFPSLPPGERLDRLWDAVFEICRLKQADPIAAWQDHIHQLAVREDYLTHKQYAALRFTGPGTDLSVGLPRGHTWISVTSASQNGIKFASNIPTEEVFTLPHRDKTQGVVTASKPLSLSGVLLENVSLAFEEGRVMRATADRGEAALRRLIEMDEGAGRLGEVALVPHSSPISQSGLLFYNALIDENAASHLALGRAYPTCLTGGLGMSDVELAVAGANLSLIHEDFMIGSAQMDVDGLREDGGSEPVMRSGEWTFRV